MNSQTIPPSTVADDEVLARFILHKRYIRSDGTLKPDSFIPHPYLDLSVTRHVGLEESSIWVIGEMVAMEQSKRLYGRGDVSAFVFRSLKLKVQADPVAGNAHHANVTNWPQDKPAQKMCAQEIAAVASFVSKPRTAI
jgi:hypothetical protein